MSEGSLAGPDRTAPRRLSPVSPLIEGLGAIRQMAVPLALAVAEAEILFILGPLVVLLVLRTLAWSRRTYEIRDGAFRLEEGIVRRKQRVVPIERIQQVNVERRLRHRAFGVARLKIQTAGGGADAELDLDAVIDAEAERLRLLLSGPRPAAPESIPAAMASPGGEGPEGDPPPQAAPGATPPPPGRVLLRLSYREAAMAGVTDSRIGLLAAIVVTAAEAADALGERLGARLESLTDRLDVAPVVVVGLVVLGLLGVMLVWVAVGAVTGVLSHGEYVLVEEADRITCRRGLLSQREAALVRHRIQVVRVDASPLRRLLGRCALTIQSAGTTGEVDRITVPYVRTAHAERLVDALLPGTAPFPPLVAHPLAARRRLRVRRIGLAAPLVVLAAAGAVVDLRWVAAAPLLVVLAWASADATYLALAHGYWRGVLVSQGGALTRRLIVVPASRAQSARLRTTPLQRRRQLATLAIDVAGGGHAEVVDAGEAHLAAVLNRILDDRRALALASAQ